MHERVRGKKAEIDIKGKEGRKGGKEGGKEGGVVSALGIRDSIPSKNECTEVQNPRRI